MATLLGPPLVMGLYRRHDLIRSLSIITEAPSSSPPDGDQGKGKKAPSVKKSRTRSSQALAPSPLMQPTSHATNHATNQPLMQLTSHASAEVVIEEPVSPSSSSSPSSSDMMTSKEDQEYWSDILKGVESPVLKTLLSKLDLSHPIGLRTRRGNDTKPSSASSLKQMGVPCYDFYLEVKKKYPRALALVQIGDFYEAVGIDAVVLCHMHSLNPMAAYKGVARCGVPLGNRARAVRAMNELGFSVAVCPEVEVKVAYGSKPKSKTRYIIEPISTPTNPHIFFEAAEAGGMSEEYYREGLPIIGVASSKSGHLLFEYHHELMSVMVTEAMTQEVLISRLQHQRAALLLLHSSVRDFSSSMVRLIKSHAKGITTVKTFSTVQHSVARDASSSPSALEGFLSQVRLEMGMGSGVGIREIKKLERDRGPIPPYLATINNLGINNSPGMPNLLDALMDSSRSGSSQPRIWLERLLRQPPPSFMAAKIHAATRCLWEASCPLPSLYLMMTHKKVVDILRKEDQAAPIFFRELVQLLEPSLELLTPNQARSANASSTSRRKNKGADKVQGGDDQLLPAADGALDFAQWEMQIFVPKAKLLDDLNISLNEIKRVVDMGGEEPGYTHSWNTSDDDGEGEEDEVVELSKSVSGSSARRGNQVAANVAANIEQVIQRLEDSNEGRFMGRINPEIMAAHISKVRGLRQEIEEELRRLMVHLSDEGDLAKHRPRVKYDENDRAVWIHVSKNSTALKKDGFKSLDLKTPIDRKGKAITDGKVSHQLESLSSQYREAADEACLEVRRQLRTLCISLQPRIESLILSAYSSIAARALIDHVDEAKRRGWCLPHMQEEINERIRVEDGKEVDAEKMEHRPSRMELKGMWPYWKERNEAVKNDLVLDRTILLTGPNMAGKSTVLRSIAAVALLGACGLAVPAESAPSVPFYDSFMLRNYSGDSPLENLSSFALEMADVKALLRDATDRSLILLDELGKGTEVDAATSLSAALLEVLCSRGSNVVYATHLHDLVKLMRSHEADGRLEYMSMQVQPRSPSPSSPSLYNGSGTKEPTWKIVPGSCIESLASQVALEAGIDPLLITRADEIYSQLRRYKEEAATALSQVRDGNEQPSSPSSIYSITTSLKKTPADIADAKQLDDDELMARTPLLSLEDASDVLHEVAWLILLQSRSIKNEEDKSQGEELESRTDQSSYSHESELDPTTESSSSSSSPLQIHTCSPNQMPPPSHSQRSAVYIIQYASGFFYCGESDSIRDRLSYHRKKKSTSQGRSRHHGPGCSIVYLLLEPGEGGKSQARSIQTKMIKEMKGRGFQVTSSGDENLKNFGA